MIVMRHLSPVIAACCVLLLSACGGSDGPAGGSNAGVAPTQPKSLDRSCDVAPFPSAQWTACEAANYAHVLEATTEQLTPGFESRWTEQSLANLAEWVARAVKDPSWLDPRSGNTALLPLCAAWTLQCTGDPFRYPDHDGPNGKQFYENEAEVIPVVFYDDGCARLSGRVWAPRGMRPGARLPAVVIENGSIQAPETAYWWAAQRLVRAGYVVMTFDPRGQGRSDMQTPTLGQGGNINADVFITNLVNAIDFFRATPSRPYPWNQTCAGTYPTAVTDFNPFHDRVDPQRLGITGHSAGAIGASTVAGFGAPGAESWPGKLDAENPVRALVAWDPLVVGSTILAANRHAVPRVPGLGLTGDYISADGLNLNLLTGAFTLVPNLTPPDHKHNLQLAYEDYVAAGVPVYSLTIAGVTHLDFSQIPTFPASSWCPDTSSGACRGGWGIGSMEYYTLAWFDRWLKKPGEAGYADADQRLVDDAGPEAAAKLSFRYHSARNYPDRSGKRQHCEDIRAGCR